MIRSDRGNTVTALVELDIRGTAWYKYRDAAARQEPTVLAGIELPECEMQAGMAAWLKEISADLARADLPSESQLFVTDLVSAFWLFGDFAPLEHGAPWYYGNLSGMETADYVLAPKCAFVTAARALMVNELEISDYTLTPIRDNELYVLYSITQP
jgi:hypothetical protein